MWYCAAKYKTSFISKDSIEKLPIFGFLAKAVQTIYVSNNIIFFDCIHFLLKK